MYKKYIKKFKVNDCGIVIKPNIVSYTVGGFNCDIYTALNIKNNKWYVGGSVWIYNRGEGCRVSFDKTNKFNTEKEAQIFFIKKTIKWYLNKNDLKPDEKKLKKLLQAQIESSLF